MSDVAKRTLPEWVRTKVEEIVWLDDDHAVTWIQWPGESEPHGGILWHRKPDSAWPWCCGSWYLRQPMHNGKTFREDVPIWTMTSKDPLTLSPSFLCHCGHHGFIREGRWVQV
jgi:hypothetical protein